MKTIRYNGPGHVLNTASGRRILRGETAEVPNSDADQLTQMPNIDVTLLEAEGTEPNQEEE